MTLRPLLLASLIAAAGCGAPPAAGPSEAAAPETAEPEAAAPAVAASVTYAKDVLPIFQARCATCHIEQTKGGFSAADHAAAMEGGKSGAVVAAGDPEGSLLYQMVAGTADKTMPPKGDPLSDAELATVRSWIESGAQ